MKKIELEKCIGVWLDHEKAFFIQPGKSADAIEKVVSNIQVHTRIAGESAAGMRLGNNRSTNNEYSKHTKEHENLKQYYKTLFSKLNSYDHVLLFGSSKAKNEFGNFIREQKPLHTKFVEVKGAEEMSENQMIAQVTEYFNEFSS